MQAPLNNPEPTSAESDLASPIKPKLFKYKYPLHIKREAIELAKKEGLKRASALLNIDKKNIERWMTKGFFHKRGAGRRTRNPQMENEIIERSYVYIQTHNKLPPRKFIRTIARLFLSERFKASKGWCDKFVKRNRIKFLRYYEEMKKSAENK